MRQYQAARQVDAFWGCFRRAGRPNEYTRHCCIIRLNFIDFAVPPPRVRQEPQRPQYETDRLEYKADRAPQARDALGMPVPARDPDLPGDAPRDLGEVLLDCYRSNSSHLNC